MNRLNISLIGLLLLSFIFDSYGQNKLSPPSNKKSSLLLGRVIIHWNNFRGKNEKEYSGYKIIIHQQKRGKGDSRVYIGFKETDLSEGKKTELNITNKNGYYGIPNCSIDDIYKVEKIIYNGTDIPINSPIQVGIDQEKQVLNMGEVLVEIDRNGRISSSSRYGEANYYTTDDGRISINTSGNTNTKIIKHCSKDNYFSSWHTILNEHLETLEKEIAERKRKADREKESKKLVEQADKLFENEEYINAEKLYLEALNILPENSDAIGKLKRIAIRTQDYDKLINILQKDTLSDEGDKADILAELALVYMEKGNYSGAVKTFFKSLSYDSSHYRVNRNLRTTVKYINEEQKESVLRRLVEINPSGDNYEELSSYYQEKGEQLKSIKLLEEFIQKNPNDKGMIDDIIDVYTENDNYEKAKEYIIIGTEHDLSFFYYAGFDYANILHKTGDGDLARKYALKVLRDDKDRYKSYWPKKVLVNEYQRNGQLYEALHVHEKAIRLFPEDYNCYEKYWEFLEKNDKVDEAEIIYLKAKRKFPEKDDVYIELADYYYEIDKTEKALTILEEGRSKCENTLDISFALAKLYFEIGNKADAIYSMKRELNSNKKDEKVYAKMGRFYKMIDDHSKAIGFYKKASNLDPDYTIYVKKIAELYWEIGDLQNAEKYYEKLIEMNSDYLNYRLNFARFYFLTDRPEKAIQKASRAILDFPNKDRAYYYRAYYFYHTNEYTKALKDCDTGLKHDSNDFDILALKGVIYSKIGNKEESMECFKKNIDYCERSLSKEPDNAYKMRKLVGCYIKANHNLSKAKSIVNRAIEIEPTNSSNYKMSGDVFNALGKFNKAIEAYNTAIKMDPNNANIYYYLSMAYYYHEDYSKAKSTFYKGKEIDYYTESRMKAEKLLFRSNQ